MLLVVCVMAWFRPHKSLPAEVIRDTVERWDAVKEPVPYPVYITEVDSYPVLVPVYINREGDTVHDAVTVFCLMQRILLIRMYSEALPRPLTWGWEVRRDSISPCLACYLLWQ